jgi:hypothetical protein
MSVSRLGMRWWRAVGLAVLLAGAAGAVAQENPAAPPLTQQHRQGAVTLGLEVDRQRITIDGRVQVTLRVEAPPSARVIWPEIGNRLGPFAVVPGHAGPPSEDESAGLEQQFALQPEDVGELLIPPFPVAVEAAPGGETLRLTTDPVTITVTSVVSPDADFAKPRDIVPPVALPERGLLLPSWALLGLLIGVALVAVIWWRQRGRRVAPDALQPADVQALAAFEQLQELIGQDRIDDFHIRLADVLRQYLSARFGLPAPVRTTEELLAAMLDSGEPIRTRRQLVGTLLGQCDLVKFARHRVGREDMHAALAAASGFVRQTRAEPGEQAVLRDALAEAS